MKFFVAIILASLSTLNYAAFNTNTNTPLEIDMDTLIATALEMIDMEGECALQACGKYHDPQLCTPTLTDTFRPRCALVLQRAGLHGLTLAAKTEKARGEMEAKEKHGQQGEGETNGEVKGRAKGKGKGKGKGEGKGKGKPFSLIPKVKSKVQETIAQMKQERERARAKTGSGEAVKMEDLVIMAEGLEGLLGSLGGGEGSKRDE